MMFRKYDHIHEARTKLHWLPRYVQSQRRSARTIFQCEDYIRSAALKECGDWVLCKVAPVHWKDLLHEIRKTQNWNIQIEI